jgi:MOSC domain-containing protein YiiM
MLRPTIQAPTFAIPRAGENGRQSRSSRHRRHASVRGINARVVEPGTIHVGDRVRKVWLSL